MGSFAWPLSPLDLLLIGLLVAVIAKAAHYNQRDPEWLAMFLGVLASSLYALVWALTVGHAGTSVGSGAAIAFARFAAG